MGEKDGGVIRKEVEVQKRWAICYVIYVQKEEKGTKNTALWDTMLDHVEIGCGTIQLYTLLPASEIRFYELECLSTNSIVI